MDAFKLAGSYKQDIIDRDYIEAQCLEWFSGMMMFWR